MQFWLLFLTDILLGFVPQAAGCAVCVFTIANQKLLSRSFLYTSLIYSAIAVIVRLAYNAKLIDFGFHTIVIWMILIRCLRYCGKRMDWFIFMNPIIIGWKGDYNG